jgi:hypothetical protein
MLDFKSATLDFKSATLDFKSVTLDLTDVLIINLLKPLKSENSTKNPKNLLP